PSPISLECVGPWRVWARGAWESWADHHAKARLQAVSQQGGMALDMARAASPETIQMLIAPTGEIEPGSCWLLAETLYLDGLHAKLVGDRDRASDSLAKAGMLFSLLKPMGAFLVGFPEASERIREIEEQLEDETD
ncbi:MAG: hypothetical protein MUO50_12735, partial [Longimicrobiales bacterium]|nr:hypothetical protein [Longimicrobiales bacterium]